jgi:hypothetical protein
MPSRSEIILKNGRIAFKVILPVFRIDVIPSNCDWSACAH